MIRSLYYHGDDQPAADLTPTRLRGALADRAGVLWIDLTAPADEELATLAQLLEPHPLARRALAERAGLPSATGYGGHVLIVLYGPAVSPDVDGPAAAEIDLLVGPNHIVSVHDAASPSLDALYDELQADGAQLATGATHIVHRLLEVQAAAFDKRLTAYATDVVAAEAAALDGAPDAPRRLLGLRRALGELRHTLGAQRTLGERLARETLPPLDAGTQQAFRADAMRYGVLAARATALRERVDGALAVLPRGAGAGALPRGVTVALWLVVALLAVLVVLGLG